MSRASSKFLKYVCVGSVCISSFMLGSYIEKKKLYQNLLDTLKEHKSIPIFDTVLAATPFSPVPQQQDGVLVNRVSQIMKYGFPGMDNIRSYDNYVLSYDRRNRVAHWTFEHLTKDNIKSNDAVDRSKCYFMPDESIHQFFRFEISENVCTITFILRFADLRIQIIKVLVMIEGIWLLLVIINPIRNMSNRRSICQILLHKWE